MVTCVEYVGIESPCKTNTRAPLPFSCASVPVAWVFKVFLFFCSRPARVQCSRRPSTWTNTTAESPRGWCARICAAAATSGWNTWSGTYRTSAASNPGTSVTCVSASLCTTSAWKNTWDSCTRSIRGPQPPPATPRHGRPRRADLAPPVSCPPPPHCPPTQLRKPPEVLWAIILSVSRVYTPFVMCQLSWVSETF